MLELTMERWGYLTVDTGEWIEDRIDGENPDADKAMIHALENGLQVEEWLNKIGATGLYGDGNVSPVFTGNEDNYLDHDLVVWLAHTEKWGDLLIIDHANAYGGYGRPTAYNFIGDDDADAYAWSSGWATCTMQDPTGGWKTGYCDAEWIVESACKLWQNGGGQTEYISDVIKHDDDLGITYAICPRCRMGNLSFYGG